jgi:hypothetical protein
VQRELALCREGKAQRQTLGWSSSRAALWARQGYLAGRRGLLALARVQPGCQPACFAGPQDSFGAHSWLIQREGGNVMMDSPRFDARLLERIKARARGLRRAGCRHLPSAYWGMLVARRLVCGVSSLLHAFESDADLTSRVAESVMLQACSTTPLPPARSCAPFTHTPPTDVGLLSTSADARGCCPAGQGRRKVHDAQPPRRRALPAPVLPPALATS